MHIVQDDLALVIAFDLGVGLVDHHAFHLPFKGLRADGRATRQLKLASAGTVCVEYSFSSSLKGLNRISHPDALAPRKSIAIGELLTAEKRLHLPQMQHYQRQTEFFSNFGYHRILTFLPDGR